jgi:hypothetical protein
MYGFEPIMYQYLLIKYNKKMKSKVLTIGIISYGLYGELCALWINLKLL